MERASPDEPEKPKKVQKTDQPEKEENVQKADEPEKADEPPPYERRRSCKVRLGNGPRVLTTIEDCYRRERINAVEFFPAMTTSVYMASLNSGVKWALNNYPKQIKLCNPSSQKPFPFSDGFGTEDDETYGWHTVFGEHHKAVPFLETLVLTHLPNVKGFHGLNVLSLRILMVYRLHDVTNAEFRKLAKLLPLEELTVKDCDTLSEFGVLPDDRISKTMWKLVLYFSEHQTGELYIDEMQHMYDVQTNARHIKGDFNTPCLQFVTINVRHMELPSEVLDMLKELFTLTKTYKLDEFSVEDADHKKFWNEDDTKLLCEAVAAFNADYVSMRGLTQEGWRKKLESYPIDFTF